MPPGASQLCENVYYLTHYLRTCFRRAVRFWMAMDTHGEFIYRCKRMWEKSCIEETFILQISTRESSILLAQPFLATNQNKTALLVRGIRQDNDRLGTLCGHCGFPLAMRLNCQTEFNYLSRKSRLNYATSGLVALADVDGISPCASEYHTCW